MTSRVILDVRSGDKNDPETGLGLRVLRESEREGYELSSDSVSGYMLFAKGDVDVGVEERVVGLTYMGGSGGKHWYMTGVTEAGVVGVSSEGEALRLLYGGTVVESERDDLVEGLVEFGLGGLYWWSRNDAYRERYVYDGGRWELIGGGASLELGVVGSDEFESKLSSVSGEIRLSGGEVYVVGSEELPIGEAYGVGGKVSEGGELEILGHEGEVAIWTCGELGVLSGALSSGDYLSPIPMANEHPLLRESGYGVSEVVYVASEDDFSAEVLRGVVEVCRDTGRVNFSGGGQLLYDGLVLGEGGYEEHDLGVVYGGGLVPVQEVPDGSGVYDGVATGFERNGSGWVWGYYEGEKHWLVVGGRVLGLEFVDGLPRRLSVGTAYVVRGSREVHLASYWRSRVGSGQRLVISSVKMLPYSEGVSAYPLGELSGTFSTDGGDVVIGGGSSSLGTVDRFGFLDLGAFRVLSPSGASERELLKGLGYAPEGMGNGLRLSVTSSRVVGYVGYVDESVGKVSGASAFQIITGLSPRRDMLGYGAGVFFKVGDKELVEGEDIEFADLGFHWVSRQKVSQRVTEETSRLALVAGLRPLSTSLSVKTEGYGGGYEVEELVEGVGYDLPSEGLEGVMRLKKVLGGDLLRGVTSVSTGGTGLDLGEDVEGVLKAGDWLYDGEFYGRIQSLSGSEVVLDRELSEGKWRALEGYREGVVGEETPDQTKLLGEVFKRYGVMERDAVEVFKIYSTVEFGKVDPTSRLYLRDVSTGVRSELVVLRDVELDAPYRVDLTDVHVSSGSYRVRVEGVDYEEGIAQGGKGFVLSGSRVEFQLEGVVDSSWVSSAILVKLPREGFAEYSLNTGGHTSPYAEYDFLEQLANVSYNGTSGAISFRDPLDAGVGVEVSYTPTDTEGVRVLESMAFTRTQEEATRQNERVYTFNPNGVEVITEVIPTVYVGAEQITGFNYTESEITLPYAVDDSVSVRITYASTEALGGEIVVKTSTSMVLPKYQMKAGETTLSMSRDVTSEFHVGSLIRLGAHVFTLTSVSEEALGVTPPARHDIEVEDLYYLSVPLSVYGEESGRYVLRQVRGAQVVSKPKSPDLYLQGDYKGMLFAKSVVVCQGVPYQVNTVSVDAETGVTKVTCEGFTLGHNFTSAPLGEDWIEGVNDFAISYRPVLTEGDTRLSLVTGVLGEEPYTLIKSGKELREGRDYRLNTEAGALELLKGVVAGDSYHLFHTSLASISPRAMLGGRISYPIVEAEFLASTAPTEFDGSNLLCQCFIYSPDTFQISVMSDEDYATVLTEKLSKQSQSGKGIGGKQTLASSSLNGKAIGYYDLLADDVVTRARILLYHGYVSPIEDLISTTSGKVVGDTDGGMKFELTQGRARGQEDPLTREIMPRYVSMELLAPLSGVDYLDPTDSILIGGEPPEVDVLHSLLEGQRALIENEMDDYVLLTQKKKMSLSLDYPFVRFDYIPVYDQMWGQHKFSRLFPQQTQMMTITSVGDLYGDRDGKSTNGFTIANVENPALGQITNVTSLTVSKRASRFRVIDYSSTGFSQINAGSDGKPTFIVSAVPYDEFPLTEDGLPDDTQFISEGGSVADAVSGNMEFNFRGLQAGDRLALSRDGVMYPIKDAFLTSTLPDVLGLGALEAPVYAKVESVLSGCLVVLEGDASTLECNGETLALNPPRRGETLAQSFAKDFDDEDTPPSTYRVGSDIGLRSATGEIIDISLSSADDLAFPFKEIYGQNVPSALTPLEGQVGFLYSSLDPFEYPALRGEAVNDSGDITIPYRTRYTERDLLPLIPPALEPLQATALNTISAQVEYVYPDEVRDNQIDTADGGWVVEALDTVGAGVCEQTPRQGDLMVIVPDDSLAVGSASTGVSEIALVEGNKVYPPHFDCPTDGLNFYLANYAVELAGDNVRGVHATETLQQNPVTTEWDVSVFELSFSEFQIGDVINKVIQDNGVATFTLFSPTLGVPVYVLRLDHSAGSLTILTGADQASLVASGNVSVSNFTNTTIEITQDPIVDVLTQAESANYPSLHETWAMSVGSPTHFWSAFPSTSDAGLLTTSLNDRLDFILDLSFPESYSDQILNDRVRLQSDLAGWFFSNTSEQALLTAGGGLTPLSVTPHLSILGSWLEVHREDAVANAFIESSVNSDLNGGNLYYEGLHYEIEDAQTFRFVPLWGVNRTDDKVSIFVGSEVQEDGVILNGTARYGLHSGGVDTSRGILRAILADHGDLDNVKKCDLVYVERGHGAGTYRVRSVLYTDQSNAYQEVLGSSTLLPLVFPKVVSLSVDGDQGTLVTDVDDLTQYFSEGGGSFYILLSDAYLVAPVPTGNNDYDQTFGQSIVKVVYDSISGNSFVFTEDTHNNTDNPTYFDGTQHGNLPTGVTLADLSTLLGAGGQTIGGMTRVPIDIMATGLFDCPTPFNLETSATVSLQIAGGSLELTGNLLVSNNLEKDDLGVTTTLLFPDIDFPDVEDAEGNIYGLSFFTPNDTISLTISLPAGIYLDPATPRLRRNYRGTVPTVWGDGSSNIRSTEDYTLQQVPGFDYYEETEFTVRRLRRFSDMFPDLISGLEGFRYLYEQRGGLVSQVVSEGSLVVLTPQKVNGSLEPYVGGYDTHVGDFPHVVSVGDQVRCYNAEGLETLFFRVTLVGDTLKGQTISGSIGDAHVSFTVTTRVGVVPELQAFNQLIAHGFDEVYSTEALEGIEVAQENTLSDSNILFTEIGVQEGDFLVIDPQGQLPNSSEYGHPPRGDDPLGNSQDPHPLDDNRGAYLVRSVTETTLEVEFYAGSAGVERDGYSFLPPVSGDFSQPLRETAGQVGGTYSTTTESIHPFSYRILRPKLTLGEEMAGTILFFRERTLSWVEIIEKFNSLPIEPSTWPDFDAGELIYLMGEADPTHPSNDILLASILGEVESAPFTSTRLSVADRRVLIEDPSSPVSVEGMPTTLENDMVSMGHRESRYLWIKRRTNKLDGTLVALSRVTLP